MRYSDHSADSGPPGSTARDREAAAGSAGLDELLKGTEIHQLFESYSALTGIPIAIADHGGNVLVSSHWRRVCTEYHRAQPAANQGCIESYRNITPLFHDGRTYAVTECLHGFKYCASPIVIEGQHMANLLVGQFLTEPLDEPRLERQAERFGFDKKAYLGAAREVPVADEEQMRATLDLLVLMTHIIADLSLERKGAMEAQARQSVILNTIPQSVLWKDLEGRYLGCNVAFAQAAGLASPEQVIGKTDYDLAWPRDEADIYRAEDRAVIVDRRPWLHIIESAQLADGRRILVDKAKVPLLDASGSPYAVLGVWSDVTKEVRAREELQASEERFRTAFRTGLDAIYIARLEDGLLIDANDEFFAVLGYEHGEAIGKTSLELNMWESPEERATVVEALKRDGFVRDVLVRARKKSGEPILVSLSQRLIWSGDDRNILGVIRDVTERERARAERGRLEAQLRQAQKMESIGRLAGGVAHDFNNLLSVILNYAAFALEDVGEGDRLANYLQQIEAAGQRAAALTRQLLAFSRKQILEPELLDLTAVARGIEKMVERLLGEDIEIVERLADDLGAVMADPGQIEQVIMNLVVNARDAMPTGGKLTIETANVDLDEAGAAELSVSPGSYVLLGVSDTGSGMDADVREQIFEPFFTTKVSGKGTGLGLSTVYGIVMQSGGQISVQSSPREGSSFKVFLPRLEAPAKSGASRSTTAAVRGIETLLVVEDEDAVRDITVQMLKAAGYTVIAARGGPEALALSERHEEPIDLLVTDLVMPQMSGRELSERLVELRPSLRVLYVSGYPDDTISDHGVLANGTSFLGKPFSARQLTGKVREILDKKA